MPISDLEWGRFFDKDIIFQIILKKYLKDKKERDDYKNIILRKNKDKLDKKLEEIENHKNENIEKAKQEKKKLVDEDALIKKVRARRKL